MCNSLNDWLHALKSKQDGLLKSDDPVLFVSDIVQKGQELEAFARPILSKPKPKPAETKPADQKSSEKMDVDSEKKPEDVSSSTNPEARMDVD